MEEIWKEYKTHKTHFRVSNLGNVEVLKWNTRKDLENIVFIDDRGRRCIGSKKFPVYLVVDRLFNGEKPKWMNVHHKDENKLNDRLDNLVRMSTNEHMKEHLTGKPSRNSGHTPWNKGLTKDTDNRVKSYGIRCSETLYKKYHTA